MPLEPFRWAVDRRGWHSRQRWSWVLLGVFLEVLAVTVAVQWHSDLVGSVGTICIVVPMLLAIGPEPPTALVATLIGAGWFVYIARGSSLPVDNRSKVATLCVWVTSVYLVTVIAGRLRRSRDLAIFYQVQAEGEERRRIAADLHDDTIQVIVASLLQLDAMPPTPQRAAVDRSMRQALDRLRSLTFHLRPPDLEAEGLEVAIPDLCEEYRPRLAAQHTHVSYSVQVPHRCSAAVEELVHRVALEALQNVYKHAHASNVAVSCTQTRRAVRLTITDDGRGFDPTHIRQRDERWQHLGIDSKIARATWLGGTLTIHSTPGNGTSVHLTVPQQSARLPHDYRGTDSETPRPSPPVAP